MDNLALWISDLPNMPQQADDHTKCSELCKNNRKCEFWQLNEGYCYLKNEDGKFQPGRSYRTVSGSRKCNSTLSKSNLFSSLKLLIIFLQNKNALNNKLIIIQIFI